MAYRVVFSPMPNLTDPLRTSVAQLTAAFQSGTLSPVTVAEAALARIEATNGATNAYVRPLPTLARQQAEAAEMAYRNGTAGPLAGVPVAIKDAFHIADQVTTLGSLFHANDVASADSGSVRRLRAAGAVFVGKTNVPEFCQSSTTDNLLGPETTNPWDITRTAGGSSGGSAAAVASGSCPLALGSDGGGSIRIPAAFTGLVGLKATNGRCADEGGFKGFSPFISLGPLAWRVDDTRRMFNVLADSNGTRQTVPTLRIAWCPQPEKRPIEPAVLAAVEEAVDQLRLLGHQVERVELPFAGWMGAFGPLLVQEEFQRRGHLLAQPEKLTNYERAALEAGAAVTSEAVAEAQTAQQAYRDRVAAWFRSYDLVVTPATAVSAFPLQQRPRTIAGQRVSRVWGSVPFSPAFNVAGTPTLVLPVGLVAGLPVAIQLAAAVNRDHFLLDAAEQLEEALDLSLFRHELPAGAAA